MAGTTSGGQDKNSGMTSRRPKLKQQDLPRLHDVHQLSMGIDIIASGSVSSNICGMGDLWCNWPSFLHPHPNTMQRLVLTPPVKDLEENYSQWKHPFP